MVVGIGVDICRVERLGRLRQRYGRRFLDRVFTAAEQAYCGTGRGADERYAARFAAKEACVKALGTGLTQGIALRDVEVVSAAGERPTLRLSGAAARTAETLGATRSHLSLSHEREYAVAFVVLEH